MEKKEEEKEEEKKEISEEEKIYRELINKILKERKINIII